MANTTVSVNNANKPAPKWFRKSKKALSILSDTTVVILLAMGHSESSLLMLILRIGLSGALEALETMLANGEVYVNTGSLNTPVIINEVATLPDTGIIGQWYHMGNNYYYWNGTSWVALYEDLGPGGGTNPPPTGLPPVKS